MKAKMTRRILALALCLAMVLTMIPAAFASSFSDVPDNAWYKNAVEYCFENKLMSGTGDGFNPGGKVTREQAVQTLYAMAGLPATDYEAIFSDVPSGKWYTNAIMWGAKNGIVNGDGKGHFNVGVNVTREQVAMFFYNYATFVGMDEDFASLNSFPDAAKVSSWAKTAVQWAVAMGVLSGKAIDGKNYLKPQDPLTRAELASILSRFYPQAPAACNHENTEIRDAKAATCVDAGYTGDTWCLDCNRMVKKGEEIKALGHIDEDGDNWCDRCDEWIGGEDVDKDYILAESISAGQQVVIYNPGHGMAVKNETDNDWYLIPEAVTPENDVIKNPDDSLVWTVVDNGDGSVSFVNGDNAIAAYISGTYVELTNNAEYPDSDKCWVLTAAGENNLYFIGSKTLANSYGPAYIECYYNANKDQTKISGYTSSNPAGHIDDYGFQFYSFGKACEHVWDEGKVTAPTCTVDGYTLYTCTKCGATKTEDIVPATGHNYVDGVCTVCGDKQKAFVLSEEIADGQQVVIYNPGHGMAIKNETDNNWYLVPEAVTPEENVINSPDASIVWTVVDNGDGTFSFVNGDNAIAAWLSGTYIELTNDANYEGADIKWNVTFTEGLAYIGSSSLSNSYGPAYIECYYNANKDKTNISGYTSSNPSAKSGDFGFQFYVSGDVCEHDWVAGEIVLPTCTVDGYTPYTCSKCNATKKDNVVPATGHTDANGDNLCDTCGTELGGSYVLASAIKGGDQVIIYNPGHGMAVSNETDNNWYLVPVAVTPADDKIANPDAAIVWTVVDNGDGTFSFTNGDNAIAAWMNNTYVELTNDANYSGADIKWNVTFTDGLAYIGSSTLSNSYGPAYIECYYNANKDKTNISGYTSSDPTAKSTDFGFQFYVKGGTICEHDWQVTTETPATCTAAGSTLYTCTKCGATKTEEGAPATGHNYIDGICANCGAKEPVAGAYILADEITDGDQVIIYNPGHGMAVKNETDNNWYLVPVAVTPVEDTIDTEDTTIVWTVVDNGDGTFSFTNGDNAIAAWMNNTYVELTNDANYSGADIKWKVTFEGGLAYIQSSSLSNSYGPAYIECYYNANKDKTNISGYTSSDPTAKSTDFGFQFYVMGTKCEHDWQETDTTEPSCTDAGYTYYECSICGKTKSVETVAALGHDWVADAENTKAPTCIDAGVNAFTCSRCTETMTEEGEAALGHIDENKDDKCDRCGKDMTAAGYNVATSVKAGDKIIIVANHSDISYAVVGVKADTDTSVNNALSARTVTFDGKAIADKCVDDGIIWTVVAGSADGTFLLKASDGKFMAYTASGTTLKTASTGTDFAITCGAGTSTVMATADGMTDRGVSFRLNATTPQFRLYKTSNNSGEYSWNITIYKLG